MASGKRQWRRRSFDRSTGFRLRKQANTNASAVVRGCRWIELLRLLARVALLLASFWLLVSVFGHSFRFQQLRLLPMTSTCINNATTSASSVDAGDSEISNRNAPTRNAVNECVTTMQTCIVYIHTAICMYARTCVHIYIYIAASWTTCVDKSTSGFSTAADKTQMQYGRHHYEERICRCCCL